MRKATFLLLATLLSFVSYAQNPYEQFGYHAPKMPELEKKKVEEVNPHVFVIVNKDTAFDIGRLEIDQRQGCVAVYSRDNVLIAFDTLDGYSSLRWLSPDPMGQHSSPYLAMSNNPVSNVDPTGGWDDDQNIAYYVDGFRVSASQFGLQYNSATNGGIEAYGSAFGGMPQYTYQNKSGMFGFWSPGYAVGEIGRNGNGEQTNGVATIVQQFNRLMDRATYETVFSQAASDRYGTEIRKGKNGLRTQAENIMENGDPVYSTILRLSYGLFNDIHKYLTGLVGTPKNLSGRIDYSASGRQDAGNGLVTLMTLGMSGVIREGMVLGEAAMSGGGTVDFVAGVRAEKFGNVIGEGTVNVRPTISAIENQQLKLSNYGNVEGHPQLLDKPFGYWQKTKLVGYGKSSPLRIIKGQQGEYFLSPDHYTTPGNLIPLNR